MRHGIQAEISANTQVSRGFLCDILHGRKTPSRKVALKLAATGIPASCWMLVDPECTTVEKLRELVKAKFTEDSTMACHSPEDKDNTQEKKS